MPINTSQGWALRLIDLLGARPAEITEEHLSRLVTGLVREDADLDFKQERYGTSDGDKRELAADIAGMANDRGGLIIIGIRDENDVAVELTPVELADGEEGRIRQTAASNIVPHLPIEISVIASQDDSSKGYYVLLVPPSTFRPHAVRKGQDLRFPRRDGATRRWLSEPEVADAYRDRYRLAEDQSARAAQLLEEGFAAMALDGVFIGVALVPTGRGSMAINLARVRAMQQWVTNLGSPNYLDGFFDPTSSPTAGVGAHRVTLMPLWEREGRPSSTYAELFDDGAGFACLQLWDARSPGSEQADAWVLNEMLLWSLGRSLHLLGLHALENCGAWGDSVVEAHLVGHTTMRLAYLNRIGGAEFAAAIDGGRELDHAVSRHTIVVDGAAVVGPELLVATRLLATDLFHAFGSAEVRQIAADGALRTRYLGAENELRAWAEQRSIMLSDEVIPGE